MYCRCHFQSLWKTATEVLVHKNEPPFVLDKPHDNLDGLRENTSFRDCQPGHCRNHGWEAGGIRTASTDSIPPAPVWGAEDTTRGSPSQMPLLLHPFGRAARSSHGVSGWDFYVCQPFLSMGNKPHPWHTRPAPWA